MIVKIWARKQTEKGGVACMPLRRNVPEGHRDWKLTTCPNCHRECWETPLLAVAKAQGASALCTECAVRSGISGSAPKQSPPKKQPNIPVFLADRRDIDRMKQSGKIQKNPFEHKEFREFMQVCEITNDDVVSILQDGKEFVYVEKEAGRRMMVKIALAMVQSGRMTPDEADEYLRHGSELI